MVSLFGGLDAWERLNPLIVDHGGRDEGVVWPTQRLKCLLRLCIPRHIIASLRDGTEGLGLRLSNKPMTSAQVCLLLRVELGSGLLELQRGAWSEGELRCGVLESRRSTTDIEMVLSQVVLLDLIKFRSQLSCIAFVVVTEIRLGQIVLLLL